MKKFILLLVLTSFSNLGFAQADKQNIKVITNSEPTYPKGDQELYNYVFNNINYSEEAKKKYLEGEVMLSFDVKTDSTVTNIIVISGVGLGVDEEVKRIVQKIKFTPAKQNGIVVKMNTMYTFPIKAH
ncbi:MAG: hypothetical protein A3F72_17275 [Bacteroidetes bacterium RIFCSPLOWO2_12_FULL_35_15]|nr:MAG: hypothetical protein A3F72_17275 [Bacteroidetes bacterium RIFCSPLOWO2_12_FULL_35_15]